MSRTAETALAFATSHETGAADAPDADVDALLQCSTCLDIFLDPVTVVPCGHSFCAHCIDRWLSLERHTCPLCGCGMQHAALSYVLKALTERQHGAALQRRREARGLAALQHFSRSVRPRMLLNSDELVERIRALRPVDLLAPRLLLGSWLFLFLFFSFLLIFEDTLIVHATAEELPLQIILRTLQQLPALVAGVFCVSFVTFFMILTAWQYFVIRRGVGL